VNEVRSLIRLPQGYHKVTTRVLALDSLSICSRRCALHPSSDVLQCRFGKKSNKAHSGVAKSKKKQEPE